MTIDSTTIACPAPAEERNVAKQRLRWRSRLDTNPYALARHPSCECTLNKMQSAAAYPTQDCSTQLLSTLGASWAAWCHTERALLTALANHARLATACVQDALHARLSPAAKRPSLHEPGLHTNPAPPALPSHGTWPVEHLTPRAEAKPSQAKPGQASCTGPAPRRTALQSLAGPFRAAQGCCFP